MRQIAFTAYRRAELVQRPGPTGALPPNEVRGRTLISLTSPGTELNWGYLNHEFPIYPGYACVFQVEEVGAEVMGPFIRHRGAFLRRPSRSAAARASGCSSLAAGLAPEKAVFARLAGVSMSTLNTTAAHRGPCPHHRSGTRGNLAAQISHFAGMT